MRNYNIPPSSVQEFLPPNNTAISDEPTADRYPYNLYLQRDGMHLVIQFEITAFKAIPLCSLVEV
jgi:hypothetical protein